MKITAKKNRNGIDNKTDNVTKKVLESKENYNQVCNPFFKFIYEEIEKLRGEKENEKTKKN